VKRRSRKAHVSLLVWRSEERTLRPEREGGDGEVSCLFPVGKKENRFSLELPRREGRGESLE